MRGHPSLTWGVAFIEHIDRAKLAFQGVPSLYRVSSFHDPSIRYVSYASFDDRSRCICMVQIVPHKEPEWPEEDEDDLIDKKRCHVDLRNLLSCVSSPTIPNRIS